MKIKVEYSESIQVAEGLWRKIGVEVEGDEKSAPDALHLEAKLAVQRWHREDAVPSDYSNNPSKSDQWTKMPSQPIPEIQLEKTSQEERIKAFAQDIAKEPTIERLRSWNKLVSQYKNYLEEPYQRRMEELNK